MANHYMIKLKGTRSCSTLMTFNVRLGYKQTVEQAVAETLEHMFGLRFTLTGDNRLESGVMLSYYFEASEVVE